MYEGNVLGTSTIATAATGSVLALTGFEELAIVMGIAFILLATVLAILTKAKAKAKA